MRSKAAQLQKLSKSFRHCQKDFLIRLKGQEEIGDNFFPDDNLDNDRDQSLSIEEALERGMTESQVQQLQELETHSSEREKEIIHVAQSINDLASIFSELSVLVLEQGTILDRIDYNVEQTLVKVQSGTEELVKADEWSKKSRTIKCIFILLIINILFLLILISKHSGDN